MKAELENADEPRPIGHLVPDGKNETERLFIIELTSHSRIAGEVPDPLSPPLGQFGVTGWEPPPKWKERLRQLELVNRTGKRLPQTVGYQIKHFLGFKAAQAAADELAPTTWAIWPRSSPGLRNG